MAVVNRESAIAKGEPMGIDDIRTVTDPDPKDDGIAESVMIVPAEILDRMSPKKREEYVRETIRIYAEGNQNELEYQGYGPVKYTEVLPRGLCYVFTIDTHGQPIREDEPTPAPPQSDNQKSSIENQQSPDGA